MIVMTLEAVQENDHMIEYLIILSNVLVGLPTLFLAIITIKEAHRTMNKVVEEEGKQRRLLLRILRTQQQANRKHRRDRRRPSESGDRPGSSEGLEGGSPPSSQDRQGMADSHPR